MSPRKKSELSGYLERYDRERSKIDESDEAASDRGDAERDVASDLGDGEACTQSASGSRAPMEPPTLSQVRRSRQKGALVSVLAAIFLAFAYIGLGFGVCAGVPAATQAIAAATIDDSASPFDKAQLVDGAIAVRDYSFGSHDLDALHEAISQMNDLASTPYAGIGAVDLEEAPSEYSLGAGEISHLDDVHGVSSTLFFPILGIAVLAAFLLMVGLQSFGVDVVRRSLLYSGIATLSFLAVLAIWAIASFDSLFAFFHSLLFDGNSWQFPADSLLITMLPEGFWIGMALLWACVSAFVSIGSISLSIWIGRRRKRLGMVAGRIDLGDRDS